MVSKLEELKKLDKKIDELSQRSNKEEIIKCLNNNTKQYCDILLKKVK
jgi:hypothetical protein